MGGSKQVEALWTTFGFWYIFLLVKIDVCYPAFLINEQTINSQISVTTANLTSYSYNVSEVPKEVKNQYIMQYPSTTLDTQGLYVPISSELDKNRSIQDSTATSLKATDLTTATAETSSPETETSGCTVVTQKLDSASFLTTITNMLNNVTSESSANVSNCYFKIQVQSNKSINVVDFLRVETSPNSGGNVSISFCGQKSIKCTNRTLTGHLKIWHPVYYQDQDHEIYVVVACPSCFWYDIRLRYTTVFKRQEDLSIIWISNKAGYIITPGFDDNEPYPNNMNATVQLNLTPDEIILISFTHLHMEYEVSCAYDYLTLSVINETGMFEEWKKCGMQDLPHMIFHTSIHLRFKSNGAVEVSGFKMLFTIMSNAKEFAINADGLFNCSVPYFSQFARHLNCNLVVECLGMDDEKECPYVTDTCGPKSIDAGEKCYTYIRQRQNLSWKQAHSQCLNLSQTLISPRNPEEWNRLSSLTLQYGKKVTMVYTGLTSSQATAADKPALYQNMLQWSDQTMALYANVHSFQRLSPVCTMFLPEETVLNLLIVSCDQPSPTQYACERFKPSATITPGKILLPPLDMWSVNVTVISCSAGHKVRDFLSCDPQSECQGVNHGTICQTEGPIKPQAIWTTFGALYFFLLVRIDVCYSALFITEQSTNSQIAAINANLTPYSYNVPTEVKNQYTMQYPSTTLDAQGLYITMSAELNKDGSVQNSPAYSIKATDLTMATSETSPLEAETSSCTVFTQTLDSAGFLTRITSMPSNVTSETSVNVTNCYFKVQVQSDQSIRVVDFLSLKAWPSSDVNVSIGLCRQKNVTCTWKSLTSDPETWQSLYYQYQDHEIYAVVACPSCFGYAILLRYTTIFKRQKGLPIIWTSDKAGYITTPGFDDNEPYPKNMNATAQLNLNPDEIVLISFTHLHMESEMPCPHDFLTLSVINDTGLFEEWKKCGVQDIPHMIFHTSIQLRFQSDSSVELSGFKMLFAILSNAKGFAINADGLFNCSVPYFSQFARHLNCNLVVECLGMEDEKECPYVSDTCGPGQIDAGEKCYTYISKRQDLSWNQAHEQCLNLSQTLISPRNSEEWNRFSSLMLQYGKKVTMVYTGLTSSQVTDADLPALYRNMLQWSDQTMALYANVHSFHRLSPVCTKFLPEETVLNLLIVSCDQPSPAQYACERFKPSAIPTHGKILLPLLDTWLINVTVISCSAGHKVRDFLSCDPQSECQGVKHGTVCQIEGDVPQFQCEHISQSIHYTLVCDFRQDCPDGSDESFCVHPPCPENSCRSGQCIRSSELCDGMQHCVDSSDETCQQKIKYSQMTLFPAKVDFNGHGGYTLEQMNESDSCPITHFPCDDGHCLPIYVRCNGVDDCPDRRDEETCDSYRCEGYFRCRASRVCLHPDHVCDGIFQCPLQDDELLCDLKCPPGCYCQGLAFVCTRRFSAKSVPFLRYLDASSTEMTLTDLADTYLIYLRLSRCNIDKIPSLSLPNMQTLDISHNVLKAIELDTLLFFKNLKALILTGNPLTSIVPATSLISQHGLKIINFSSTHLVTINSTIFANFPDLQELNLSSRSLTTITEEGFNIIQNMAILDFRRSQLATYPSDMLKNLKSLKTVYADDFKLCCKAVLPEDFDMKNCHAPSDYIASCEDLLRSDVYRVCLWMFAFLALLGNVGSFVARFYFQTEPFQNSFNVLVTNLSIADFLMGVYLAIIGVADAKYRGRYLWSADNWKQSIACKTAGFLSFLSTEVSAFFICLITLDRFLVLSFPISKAHFGKKSAIVASGIAWLIGFILAVVPLLPMMSIWKFYSHTGICIPLPFTGKDAFQGHSYSFSVMIVLNLVIFLLIAVGQVFICSVVPANSQQTQVNKKEFRDAAIARRLSTIVATDFLCWFPIGLLGLLSFTGISIPVDVSVGFAIYVLPFNSALNPFLYTFNIIMEKRRKAAEDRIQERFETRHFSEISRHPAQPTVTKDTALNKIENWLGGRVLTLSDLANRFDMMPKLAGIEAESTSSLQTINNIL